MQFADWIKTNQLTLESVARRLAVGESVVSKYARRRQVPRADIMRRIVLLTGGQVMPNDFYDLPELQMALPLPGASAERRVA